MRMTKYLYFTICLILLSCHDDISLLEEPAALSTPSVSPLTRAAADTVTLKEFRRGYGVGFSYDGVYGRRCNPQDVRSRVLDLEAIRQYEQLTGSQGSLFSTRREHTSTYDSKLSLSRSQYVQNSIFHADAKAKLIIFNGEAQADFSIWEQGDVNDMFLTVSYTVPSLTVNTDVPDVTTAIQDEGHTELLTPNFREAVAWLSKHNSTETIDSFLACYGSHVVVSATAGGSINMRIRLSNGKYVTVTDKELLARAAVARIVKGEISSGELEKATLQLDKADCSLEILGGDLGKIPNDMLNFTFGEAPQLSGHVSDWAASISYDPDEIRMCNLEMTDMDLAPIWQFIPDDEVARLVRLRLEGTARDIAAIYGNHNYVNTSFRLTDDITCQMGDTSVTFHRPPTANVIAAGHYVATVCRETIALPSSPKAEVSVVYPVYDGEVNLQCGYCVYQGEAYSVRWQGGTCITQSLGKADSDSDIYITLGVPSATRYANINYIGSNTVVGYEWPESITRDGLTDTAKPYFLVYKKGVDFLLRNTDGSEQQGLLNALPNWTYDAATDRMVRQASYRYYWNANEISYNAI